jgi:thiosulfate/3-mercaptopyruvate sulfurtransferase
MINVRGMQTLLSWLLVTSLFLNAHVYAAQCGHEKEVTGSGVLAEMLVSTEWLAQHLHDPDVIVLCVAASPGFCDKGRIPGARFVALGEIAVTRDGVPNELPPLDALQHVFETAGMKNDSRVVMYGERYGLFAARGYYTLDYLGIADHAALLNGGLEKWKAEGRELSGEAPRVNPGKLVVKAKPEILIELNDMEKIAGDPGKSAILDARPADEFSGAKISEDVPLAGHIPHAAGLYWMRLLESTANPVLRPVDELRELFTQAGVKDGGQVVTYCRSGMQSSYDYFVAKYLGYDAAMYDGSFYEWSRKGLPVVQETGNSIRR